MEKNDETSHAAVRELMEKKKEIKEAIRSLLQEMILPEFERMKAEQGHIKERLNSVDKRLNDINIHLVDQSRRIDETNKRIDSVRDELVAMINETNRRIDKLYETIVRKDEHVRLQRDMELLKRKVQSIEMMMMAT